MVSFLGDLEGLDRVLVTQLASASLAEGRRKFRHGPISGADFSMDIKSLRC